MVGIGQILKEAREAKGISLEDLQEQTKIQKRYLSSIEEGNFHVLPGDFYVRAFIKQYAEAVGLRSESILEQYREALAPQKTPESEAEVEVEEKPAELKRGKKEKISVESSKIKDYLPRILVVVSVFAILVSVWVFFQWYSPTSKKVEQSGDKIQGTEVEKPETSPLTEKPKVEEPVVEPPKVEVPKQEVKVISQKGIRTTLEMNNMKAFVVEVTATENSYFRIRNTKGKSFFEAELQKGQTQTVDISTEMDAELNIGYTPGVIVKINGEVLAYPLDAQANNHQIITIKSIKAQ